MEASLHIFPASPHLKTMWQTIGVCIFLLVASSFPMVSTQRNLISILPTPVIQYSIGTLFIFTYSNLLKIRRGLEADFLHNFWTELLSLPTINESTPAPTRLHNDKTPRRSLSSCCTMALQILLNNVVGVDCRGCGPSIYHMWMLRVRCTTIFNASTMGWQSVMRSVGLFD